MNLMELRKLLLSQKQETPFGERAYIKVRVDPKMFPVPCPALPPELELGDWGGQYIVKGKPLTVLFSEVSCSKRPTADDGSYCVQKSENGGWSWWEIRWHTIDDDGEILEPGEPLPEGPVWLDAHRARDAWIMNWIHLGGEEYDPVRTYMYDAVSSATTTHFEVEDTGKYSMTFGVKCKYRERAYRLCSFMYQWMQAAAQAGLPIEIVPAK